MKHTAKRLGAGLAATVVAASLTMTACNAMGRKADTDEGGISAESAAMLQEVLGGDFRSEKNKARDAARHPAETLAFFGVEADMNVVEIWPGAGWYTEVLAPYLKKGGGTFTAAHWDTSSGQSFIVEGVKRYKDAFADADTYGTFEITSLSDKTESMAPDGSADVVLTFRNVHNWLPRGSEEAILAQAYKALKPGGTFGVIDHRAPADAEIDPKSSNGYVNEQFAIDLIEKAGFEFVGKSEVNANAKDTADHPFGVWTLPPTLTKARRGEEADPNFDQAPFITIGESDRFTLKFKKPN